MSDRKLADDIDARRARVQALMRQRGLSGLIIYFGGQHSMLRMNQLLYLSDFKSLGASALMLPADGLPTLIITPPLLADISLTAMPTRAWSLSSLIFNAFIAITWGFCC